MRAEELRLGNLVENLLTRQEEKVSALTSMEGHSPSINGQDVEDFIGIRLTRERLVKFGFTQAVNFQEGILSLNGVRMVFFKDKWQWNDLTRNKQINYVHQLQNLYFALTGGELMLTENATI